MAREVYGANTEWTDSQLDRLEQLVALVRADEREACAKVCSDLVPDMSRTANDASVWDVATFDCAEAIRARSGDQK
jgi:hypothetical protein